MPASSISCSPRCGAARGSTSVRVAGSRWSAWRNPPPIIPIRSHVHAAMASGNCPAEEMQEFVAAIRHPRRLAQGLGGPGRRDRNGQEGGRRAAVRKLTHIEEQESAMAQISDMKGKAALVTGAASGLGRASAIKLAGAGANLCLVDVNAAGLQDTAGLLAASGVDVLVHAADLAEPDNCRAAVEAAVARFGRLDALCNIAGIIFLANSHRDAGRTMAQDHGHQPVRAVLPVTGGDPAPARGQWRDRQCRILCRFHRRGLCRRLLRHQGRAGEPHQGDGHGVHEAADPDQCGGAGRNDHQHRRQLPARPKAATSNC